MTKCRNSIIRQAAINLPRTERSGASPGRRKHDYPRRLHNKCASTAHPGEWCWFSDACSLVINYYDDPNLKYDEEAYNKAKEKYGGVEDFDSFEIWTKEDEAMPDCEMSFEIHF